MKRLFITLILLAAVGIEARSQQVLAAYVDSALQNNIVLQQKNIALTRAEYALKIARGMFLPSVALNVDYLSARGGRDINLPIGDMLNGVYSTLNQLTQSHDFPQLENQHINFLPNDFYDAKVRISMPIINSELTYNKRIEEDKKQMSDYEVDVYKRELVKEVKTAYYAYLQAQDAVNIYRSALDLAQEGKRVNESLLKNGKGLPAYVIRAESEIESVEAELVEAGQMVDQARRYFNFLLNRQQEDSIMAEDHGAQSTDDILQKISKTISTSGREELKILDASKSLQENIYKMNKSVFYPTLSGFLDLGSQYEHWQFNDQSRYYMVGLNLSMPLFAGNTNRLKIKQAQLDMKNAALQKVEVAQQLTMSSAVAQSKLKSAYHKFLSAQKQRTAAETYQRLIGRGYKEGTNTYIETVDARAQLVKAKMAESISRYQMLSAEAALERETASYSFE